MMVYVLCHLCFWRGVLAHTVKKGCVSGSLVGERVKFMGERNLLVSIDLLCQFDRLVNQLLGNC